MKDESILGVGQAVTEKEQAQEPKPLLSITPAGDLTLFIPLARTGDIFARGFVDVARTEIIKWYVVAENKHRELAALAAKTGFQRFKDKIIGVR